MLEVEIDCHIGPDRLAYSNNRNDGRGDWPIVGLFVHPRTGLIREQRVARRSRSRVSRRLSIAVEDGLGATVDLRLFVVQNVVHA